MSEEDRPQRPGESPSEIERVPHMAERVLLLRCACRGHHLDIDLWFERDAQYVAFQLDEPDSSDLQEAGLTFFDGWHGRRPWRMRLAAALALLRGRDYVFNEVVLTPKDVARVAELFSGLDSGRSSGEGGSAPQAGEPTGSAISEAR